MRKRVLTLVLGGALGFSSLAMAGDLTSSDSDFLFKNDKVKETKAASKTISDKEMKETQGKALLNVHLNNLLRFNKLL